MTQNLIPHGAHTLKLVKYFLVPEEHKVTLVFEGLGEFHERRILRTFKTPSGPFIDFLTKYGDPKNPIEEELERLEGKAFEVEVGPAKNPVYSNITKFLN